MGISAIGVGTHDCVKPLFVKNNIATSRMNRITANYSIVNNL